jgi:hypothetical protein
MDGRGSVLHDSGKLMQRPGSSILAAGRALGEIFVSLPKLACKLSCKLSVSKETFHFSSPVSALLYQKARPRHAKLSRKLDVKFATSVAK